MIVLLLEIGFAPFLRLRVATGLKSRRAGIPVAVRTPDWIDVAIRQAFIGRPLTPTPLPAAGRGDIAALRVLVLANPLGVDLAAPLEVSVIRRAAGKSIPPLGLPQGFNGFCTTSPQ